MCKIILQAKAYGYHRLNTTNSLTLFETTSESDYECYKIVEETYPEADGASFTAPNLCFAEFGVVGYTLNLEYLGAHRLCLFEGKFEPYNNVVRFNPIPLRIGLKKDLSSN